MSYEKQRPWIVRTARGLAYLMVLTPAMTVMAADSPDEAPPAAGEGAPPPPPDLQESPEPIPADPPDIPASVEPNTPAPAEPVAPGIQPSPPTPGTPGVNGTVPPPNGVLTPTGAGPAPFVGQEREVLLMPFDTDETVQGVPGEVVTTLPSRIATLLSRTYGMNAPVFYRTSPLVQRAVRERRLTETQAGNPQVTDYPAVAREFGVDRVVTGTVSSYTFDRAANNVEIGLTLDVRDLTPGGRTRVIAVSGRSGAANVVSSEIALATEAANDAATRAATEIGGMFGLTAMANPLPMGTQPKKARKKRSNALAAIGALVVLVAIIAGNRGGNNEHNNGGIDTGTTPPPPDNGGSNPPPPPF